MELGPGDVQGGYLKAPGRRSPDKAPGFFYRYFSGEYQIPVKNPGALSGDPDFLPVFFRGHGFFTGIFYRYFYRYFFYNLRLSLIRLSLSAAYSYLPFRDGRRLRGGVLIRGSVPFWVLAPQAKKFKMVLSFKKVYE